MAQATLNRVLEEIKTLDPDELRQVQRVVEAQLTPAASEDPDEPVLQAMLKAGPITEIKRPDRTQPSTRPLVQTAVIVPEFAMNPFLL